MGDFDTNSSLAIIILAALIHASFQASVSTLTLMSSHSLGAKVGHKKLLRLTGGFVSGVAVITLLLLSTLAFLFAQLFPTTPLIVWAISCGAMVGCGIAVWMFYYREKKGTSLWLPRSFASYLNDRSKATKQPAEAFGLGIVSGISELLFIAAPLVATSLVLIRLSPELQLIGTLLYVVLSLVPLLVFSTLLGGGHTLARMQRWRESNKQFLQFAAGSALLVLGMYVYIERVIIASVASMGVGF
jgi:hypothetical protein